MSENKTMDVDSISASLELAIKKAETQKTIIGMRGVPGSGKSTFVEQVIIPMIEEHNQTTTGRQITYQVVSADDYFRTPDNEYNFSPKLLRNAHNMCYRNYLKALQDGIDIVIIDNTNTQLWHITPYTALALIFEYGIMFMKLLIHPVVAHKRNIHGVAFNSICDADREMEAIPAFMNELTLIET